MLGRINDLTIWKLVTFNIFEKKNNDPFRRGLSDFKQDQFLGGEVF